MDAQEGRKSHDQVFSFKFIPLLKWVYHKSHTCMCIDHPKRLVASQWPIPAPVWLSYRVAIAILTILTTVHNYISNILYEQNKIKAAKYFIYLTHWGMITLAICMTTKAFTAIKYFAYLEPGSELTRTPALILVSWIFSNVSNVLALTITVGYWGFTYDGSRIIFANTIYSHIINSVVTLLELLLSATPVHFAHFYQPLLLGWTYLLFTYVYYVSGGTDEGGNRAIYPFLNWADPSKTVLFSVVGGTVSSFVLHGLIVLICWTRTQIAKRVGTRSVARAQKSNSSHSA